MKIRFKWFHVLIGVLAAIVILAMIGILTFLGLQISGRSKLYQKSSSTAPKLELSELSETMLDASEIENSTEESTGMENAYTWQEGDIRYQGDIYRYNQDALTFLFLGIDKMDEIKIVKEGIKGGQADALFLLILNPHSMEASIIGIPRDTMTDIDVYNENGDYIGGATAQIALQHGYGDGGTVSCERTLKAVSHLFYDLSIQGYCSINMGAISQINDAVGGVELEVLEDVPGTDMKQGTTILLKGKTAYQYLHNRDTKVPGSAGGRLERQKQYLTAYAAKAIDEIKKDITLPVTLYTTLSKYMVTDITIDEVGYLASQAIGYHFDSSRIYSLQGETLMGDEYEEFYLDENALYQLILQVFYEKL